MWPQPGADGWPTRGGRPWARSIKAKASMSSSALSAALSDAPRKEAGIGYARAPAARRAPLLTLVQEGFSPDPYLTGVLIGQTVQGIQSAGVIACTKHYILNEQEHFRQAPESRNWGWDIAQSYSANVDDKTMHELYLW